MPSGHVQGDDDEAFIVKDQNVVSHSVHAVYKVPSTFYTRRVLLHNGNLAFGGQKFVVQSTIFTFIIHLLYLLQYHTLKQMLRRLSFAQNDCFPLMKSRYGVFNVTEMEDRRCNFVYLIYEFELLCADVSESGGLGVCSSENGKLWVWETDIGR